MSDQNHTETQPGNPPDAQDTQSTQDAQAPSGEPTAEDIAAQLAAAQAQLPFSVRALLAVAQARGQFREIAKGLKSSDAEVRKMSRLFFASLVGAVLVIVFGLVRLKDFRAVRQAEINEIAQAEKKIKDEQIQTQQDQIRAKEGLTVLGSFQIELKKIPGEPRNFAGKNVADVEMTLQTDGKETREYIENHVIQVRNEIITVFTTMERDVLMSRDGKRKLKKDLIDRLNAWLPHGKIDDLYFTRFILG